MVFFFKLEWSLAQLGRRIFGTTRTTTALFQETQRAKAVEILAQISSQVFLLGCKAKIAVRLWFLAFAAIESPFVLTGQSLSLGDARGPREEDRLGPALWFGCGWSAGRVSAVESSVAFLDFKLAFRREGVDTTSVIFCLLLVVAIEVRQQLREGRVSVVRPAVRITDGQRTILSQPSSLGKARV